MHEFRDVCIGTLCLAAAFLIAIEIDYRVSVLMACEGNAICAGSVLK